MSEFDKWKNIIGALAIIGFLFVGAMIANALLVSQPSKSNTTINIEKAIVGAGTDTLTDGQNGITVSASPKVLSASQTVFSISMDNHSISLDEDLLKTTIIMDADGTKYKPSEWAGSPPGGHHRSGELIFPGIKTNGAITLIFSNVGGAAQRVFKWNS